MQHTSLEQYDPQIADLIEKELKRQRQGLVMIPSENFASEAVLAACGSVLTNKYAEGYPNKRYYTGNQYIDQIEQLAIDRAKTLFGMEHANVQPHSGSNANMAAYAAVLQPQDKIMAMDLACGGHLTHGNPVNFSGKTYPFIHYGVDPKTERLNMDEVRKLAFKERPKLIVAGITAYPRQIDFDAFADIALEIQAYLLADISHIAGLCLAGLHPTPCLRSDIVTTTTTKTLRGPRSAIILCKQDDFWHELYHPSEKRNLAQLIDATIFPGLQGGPLEHIIAAKAVCFKEAMEPSFFTYQRQILKNAEVLAKTLMENGLRLVTGGTDNHLMIIDCTSLDMSGKDGAHSLAEVGIYTNFNMIPYDTRKPLDPSGIRLGTPALTTRGFMESDMEIVGKLIANILRQKSNNAVKEEGKKIIEELTTAHPIYPSYY